MVIKEIHVGVAEGEDEVEVEAVAEDEAKKLLKLYPLMKRNVLWRNVPMLNPKNLPSLKLKKRMKKMSLQNWKYQPTYHS